MASMIAFTTFSGILLPTWAGQGRAACMHAHERHRSSRVHTTSSPSAISKAGWPAGHHPSLGDGAGAGAACDGRTDGRTEEKEEEEDRIGDQHVASVGVGVGSTNEAARGKTRGAVN